MLDALQELTRLAVHQKTGERSRLMLDVAHWRRGRRDELAALGDKVARRVLASGEREELTPMTPFERKIVHDAVVVGRRCAQRERGRRALAPRRRAPRSLTRGCHAGGGRPCSTWNTAPRAGCTAAGVAPVTPTHGTGGDPPGTGEGSGTRGASVTDDAAHAPAQCAGDPLEDLTPAEPTAEAAELFGDALPRVRRYAELLAGPGREQGVIGPPSCPGSGTGTSSTPPTSAGSFRPIRPSSTSGPAPVCPGYRSPWPGPT